FTIATHAACRYLKRLHRKFGDWHLAWASYNAGEGRIARAMKRTGAKTYWQLVDKKAIPKETRHYVPKILAAAIIAKNAASYGFTDIQGQTPLTYDELRVRDALDLKRLARALRVTLRDLRELNPSLLHDMTPPRRKSVLRVPVGLGDKAKAWIAKVPPLKLVDLAHYRIRRGDTLSGIARRFGVSIASIRDFNSLRNVHSLKVGQKLVIPRGKKIPQTRTESRRTVVASAKERKHVVSNGETLWSISRRYGCTVEQLKQWNTIRGNGIRSGQVLAIRR
ncbi:MAG: LysM peptidoglycan-binding domain-containing protein, partial [Myxococcota bacterium]